jgi:hypothetical protein
MGAGREASAGFKYLGGFEPYCRNERIKTQGAWALK